jgi:hypothetical protein
MDATTPTPPSALALSVKTAAFVAMLLMSGVPRLFAASDLSGRLVFNAVGLPGATVTVTQGARVLTTTSDADGAFRFSGLEDGVWALHVEMRGFVPMSRDVTIPPSGPPLVLTLTMQSFAVIVGSFQGRRART